MEQLIKSGMFNKKVGALVAMDHDQGSMFAGRSFEHTQSTAVDGFDTANVLAYLIGGRDSAVRIVLNFDYYCSGIAFLEMFEDDGEAENFNVEPGDAVVPVNQDRNADTVSTLTANLWSAPTITAAVDDVRGYNVWVGGGPGSDRINPSRKIILKQNTNYLLRLTSFANNSEGSLIINWDEYPILDN